MSRRSGSPTLDTIVLFAIVFAVQVVVSLFTGLVGLVGVHDFLFVLQSPLRQPWAFVTSVYAHASLAHLLSNTVALVLVGFLLERRTTRARFHAFFVVSGALAGIAQVFVGGPGAGVLGASGAVFALYGYVLGGNRLTDGILARLNLPGWVEYAVFLVVALVLTLATSAPRVALVAHFTGFLVGVAAGRVNLLAVSQRPAHGTRKESY
ncbi:rhomboid family intramembrane serine protease [Haloarchaeobius sp. HRN-SO-5]|uniref:rhomboid family intramembrane serine protease n=1 Tax=Haloarchaeobius sp. HRN-SO-5 TaxID=3446118 RepID=UPI003EBADB8F